MLGQREVDLWRLAALFAATLEGQTHGVGMRRDEALQCLVTKSELAKGEIAFASKTTLTEPDNILGCVVLRAVIDAEVFVAALARAASRGAV